MSEASHVSRYRPAVLTITGVAAAWGIYILYTTYADRPAKSALHRSNAVHRGRPDRLPRVDIEHTGPTADAPLGVLVLNRRSQNVEWNIATDGVPPALQLMPQIGLPNEQASIFQRQLDSTAIMSVLQACILSRSATQLERMDAFGLRGLCEVMEARDVDGVKRYSTRIAVVLPSVSMEQINLTIETFVHMDPFQSPDEPSSDSEVMTLAETEDADGMERDNRGPSQGLKGLLYHIAEADAKRKAYEHRGIHCEGCGERPIQGVRWHCLNCPDFDLCSTCEADEPHIKTHVFAKIKIPLPVLSQPTKECPIWYPGDPRKIHLPLKSGVKKRLQDEYDFDGPQIDAHYDQFTCIANLPWASDPCEVKAAIDRRAFNKALTSERWSHRFRPNAVYDRMFAFYDTNNDGLIGFEEFVSGLAYLRGQKRFTPLTRALKGFDVDGDGCVERSDFIRLLRAKHEIQKLIVDDMIQVHEADHTRDAMETLRSSHPISSIFSIDDIPEGEERAPQGKVLWNGDMMPPLGTKTVLEDDEGWTSDSNAHNQRRNRNNMRGGPQERLQDHLSRFEEMLDSPTDEANSIHRGTIDGSNDTGTQSQAQPNGLPGADAPGNANSHPNVINGDAISSDYVLLNQDVLWQFVEEGFHEMLDRLFRTKEQEDYEVTESREERQRWREQIDEIAHERRKAKEKKVHFEDLDNAAMLDPLVETAINSEARGPMIRRGDQEGAAFVPGPFVATDSESLTKREEEISQQPLEELLSATGYRRVDGGEHHASDQAYGDLPPLQTNGINSTLSPGSPLSTSGDDSFDEHLAPEASATSTSESELTRDPTMPQNMPNSSTSPITNHSSKDIPGPKGKAPATQPPEIPQEPPSRERLEHLVTLDQRERQMKLRGGPGRLSYDEVEDLVAADTSKELRGLVISWLEWASF